jgi:hypothetical protein
VDIGLAWASRESEADGGTRKLGSRSVHERWCRAGMQNPGFSSLRCSMMSQSPPFLHPSSLSTLHRLLSFDWIPNSGPTWRPPCSIFLFLSLELELELIPQTLEAGAELFPKGTWGAVFLRQLEGWGDSIDRYLSIGESGAEMAGPTVSSGSASTPTFADEISSHTSQLRSRSRQSKRKGQTRERSSVHLASVLCQGLYNHVLV